MSFAVVITKSGELWVLDVGSGNRERLLP